MQTVLRYNALLGAGFLYMFKIFSTYFLQCSDPSRKIRTQQRSGYDGRIAGKGHFKTDLGVNVA